MARGVRRLRHGRPRLTLVVTAAGTETRMLRATLESARNQQSPALEILVVALDPEGLRVAREVAGGDTRVRFLDAADVAAARVTGIRQSRSSHVVLAAPGDVYPRGAMAAALDLLPPGRSPMAPLVLLAEVDDTDGAGDLVRTPEIAQRPLLGRLVLTDPDPAILVGDTDVDGVATALRLLRSGFTATSRPAYRDARLEGAPPFRVRVDPLPHLGARVVRDRAALAALDGLDAARACYAAGALSALRPFLEVAEIASDAAWEALRGHVRDLGDVAGSRLDALDVVPRAWVRLASEDRRDDLVALVAARRFAGTDFPTTLAEDAVVADLGAGLDPADLVVAPHESRLRAQARRLAVAEGRLVLEVLAGVAHLDQVAPPQVQANLVDGDRICRMVVATSMDPAVTRWMAETEHDHDAGRLLLSVPVEDLGAGSWRIELTWDTSGVRRTGWVEAVDKHGSAARSPVAAGLLVARLHEVDGRVRLELSDTTPAQAPADPTPASSAAAGQVAWLEVAPDGLHLEVGQGIDRVWLRGDDMRAEGVRRHRGSWVVPLAGDVWGLGERPLATGSYRLRLEQGGAPVEVRLAAPLVDRLPEEVETIQHRVQLWRAGGDGLTVRVDPPLAADEIGARAQRLLQAGYAEVTEPLDSGLVYFQSFTGQWANDHPLAIQQELAHRRPDVRIRWLVADSSASVPSGADPVLYRSRDWYDVLARAGHLVTNIELERWFHRRPGQQILQTFHGYPSKTMGLGLWRSRGLLPSHLEQQLDHTSRTWNALLTPDPEMDRYYREEYAYDGRILALGYPRDDVLVGLDSVDIREDTRHRLGIAPGQRAVLYAPTWRDDLATNFRAAQAVHHLDVDQAASMLGGEYVLLLRGHRFHTPTDRWGSRVIDVTTYPDINDLILASDAAVLDYSSLRFDFALTGRPMVFLVPDLDTYGSRTRGFLWDFGETAPGPLVVDTAGVVAELADLDALARRWADPLTAFNSRYNALQDGLASARVVTDFFADLPEPVSEA